MVLTLQPYVNWCRPNNPDCVDSGSCECAGHASYHIMGQVVFYRQTTTEVGDGRPQDATLHLVGNYPNPFNPQTTIEYHLARPGQVVVTILDAEGNLVRTVRLDHAAAGSQSFTWQGRDDAGRAVPSGLYLYEVRHGAERVGGKMLLLK
ncbi:MAG: FlgD immunoglobulin-like domain containing protein [Candidatus Krumholzibacteriia bacterium]